MIDKTSELLTALATASSDKKDDALKVLTGDAEIVIPGNQHTLHEPFMTIKDVSGVLGISTCTLWRYKIPGYALGGRTRYKLSEVETYLSSSEFAEKAQELREQRQNKQHT